MNTPKISVIVPVYNVEQFLPRCIESILAQTYTDFELLLIDDGSPDNSGRICDEYAERDSRIRVFHIENKGVSHARNLGIIKADGEWIIYIDSDDYFLPNALDLLYSAVNEANITVCTANHFVEKKGIRRKTCFGTKKHFLKNNFKAYFFKIISPRAGSTLFHKSILKNNLFDENLCRYEDLKSLLDIMRTSEIMFIPNCIMCYTLDQEGLSKKASNIKKDFLFSLNFKNKSFWERVILADLIYKQKELYNEYIDILYNLYKTEWKYILMVKMLNIIRKVYHKLKGYGNNQ